jgi:hypothetical protein
MSWVGFFGGILFPVGMGDDRCMADDRWRTDVDGVAGNAVSCIHDSMLRLS